MRKWEKLPEYMQTEEVRKYYDILKKKGFSLLLKRLFDIVVSALLLIILAPFFLVLAIAIKIDSRGPVFFRQVRVTRYGKKFRIFKFRTMVNGADKKGSQVTVKNDARITRVGRFIRKCRLDEISQLIDVFRGTMTFVGTRPEVGKYVSQYTPEMYATLLLPAGVTSNASIYYKDESELLDASDNPDETYVNEVLPAKMHYNLKSIEKFGFFRDIGVMFKTVFAVLGKKYKGDYVAPQKVEQVCKNPIASEKSDNVSKEIEQIAEKNETIAEENAGLNETITEENLDQVQILREEEIDDIREIENDNSLNNAESESKE